MKGPLGRAKEAFRAADFRKLFFARITSQTGDGFFNAAIVTFVAFDPASQNTAAGVAKSFAILLVPFTLIGPFAGVFIDRWSRRRILSLTPVLRAAGALLLIGGQHPAPPFLIGAILAVSANRFFLSAAGAVTPRVVPSPDLLVANSVMTIGGALATTIGAFAGGLLAGQFSTRPVLAVMIGLWLLAGWLASRIGTDLSAEGAPTMRLRRDIARIATEFADGLRLLARTPRALAPISSIAWDQFLQGIIFVISLVVFRQQFREGVGSYSWLLAVGAVGLLLGVALVGNLEGRLSKQTIVAVAFAMSGCGLLVVAAEVSRATVLAMAFLVGFAYAWKKIPVDTMVQEAVPDDYRGRVFSVYDVGFNAARVGAGAAAVYLIDAAGVRPSLLLAAAGFLAWVPVLPLWLRRAPEFAVRFYSGARADEVPRAIVRGGIEEPVEVEGSFEEERDGVRIRRFRLRLRDGERLDVFQTGEGGWTQDPPPGRR